MKKTAILCVCLMLLSVCLVSATEPRKEFRVTLASKDPDGPDNIKNTADDWSIVQNNMGTVFGYQYYATVWIPDAYCYTSYKWDSTLGMRVPYEKCVDKKTTVTRDYISFQSGWQVLEPNTDYTLVYYGDESLGINDEWNHVTCIMTKNSGSYGYISMNTAADQFEWDHMINDGIDQKFWLVKTSDLDCANKKFTAWNPENILFETSFI